MFKRNDTSSVLIKTFDWWARSALNFSDGRLAAILSTLMHLIDLIPGTKNKSESALKYLSYKTAYFWWYNTPPIANPSSTSRWCWWIYFYASEWLISWGSIFSQQNVLNNTILKYHCSSTTHTTYILHICKHYVRQSYYFL